MLTIRYSNGSLPEVELAAKASEFAAVAVSIATLANSEAEELVVPAKPCDPAPYQRCLSTITIAKAAGRLVISRTAESLFVVGNPLSLKLFAGNPPVESDLPNGYHVHFECLGREAFVSPESMPLVLCIVDTV